MPDKKQILNSIASIAKKLGRAPSLAQFVARSGISKHSVFRLFPKWNEAVRAAGLEPCRLYVRPEDSDLLEDWGETVRKNRTLLTRRAYRLAGTYYPLTLAKRFGGWESVPQAFRNFARGKREWADVLALLPPPVANEQSRPLRKNSQSRRPAQQLSRGKTQLAFKDRATYGDPIHFRSFRHEPVNEQGVVLLFGMLAQDLSYMIEAVQKGFPDCEAKREIAPGRWQRVRIEFEYESKNFRQHGHSSSGCDVIVCWRHNWEDCPKHIEVVELSSVIKSLASSEG